MKEHWFAISLVLLLVLPACSTRNNVAPIRPVADVPLIPSQNSGSPPLTLGEGDKLSVYVWRNDDLNRTIQIDPTGRFYYPLIGEVQASGKTIPELRQELTKRLTEFVVAPQVDVNIVTITSRKIHVLGEVKTPGTFTLEQKVSVLEAIAKAGGFTYDSNKRGVLLIRKESDEVAVNAINLDIKNLQEQGIPIHGVYLQRDDIVYVPQSKIASVEQFMTRLANIISPFLAIERGIVLGPDTIDVLTGNTEDDKRDVVVSP